jgi:hypothetical protein
MNLSIIERDKFKEIIPKGLVLPGSKSKRKCKWEKEKFKRLRPVNLPENYR